MPREIYWNAIQNLNGGQLNWNVWVNSLTCKGKSNGMPVTSIRMAEIYTEIPGKCSGMSGKSNEMSLKSIELEGKCN